MMDSACDFCELEGRFRCEMAAEMASWVGPWR
jgi:hypothetical protein